MTEPENYPRPDEGGPGPLSPFRRLTTRAAESRAKLAGQPWPEFLKDLAIRWAVVAVIAGIVALAIWYLTK